MQEDREWTLAPGDTIKRTELHLRFGGSGQGGISPSRKTPNVFLFTDPVGVEHGYIGDGPGENGTFNYSGEGQHGDQTFSAGNDRVLRHKDRGASLRLFQGAKDRVTYVDEFELDPDSPFSFAPAPETGGGPMRQIIIFHLRRSSLEPPIFGGMADLFVSDVPVERYNTESFFVGPAEQSGPATRREAALVKRFHTHLTALGFTVSRKRIVPPGERIPLLTDLHVDELNLLIEAKGTCDRGAFRTAIGQLADYKRFLDGPRCAILLPSEPSADLKSLAEAENIELFWPDEHGFKPLL